MAKKVKNKVAKSGVKISAADTAAMIAEVSGQEVDVVSSILDAIPEVVKKECGEGNIVTLGDVCFFSKKMRPARTINTPLTKGKDKKIPAKTNIKIKAKKSLRKMLMED